MTIVIVVLLTLAASLIGKGMLFAPVNHEHLHGAAGAFFEDFLKVYTPRRVCMFMEPGVIWLHFIADFLIALSYFSIPVALVYFVRKREDLSFSWIFWMFAGFIMLCGTTHILGMWALWHPLYKLDGVIKLLTGIVSVITAAALWPLLPKALALPSTATLEKMVVERTSELRSSEERFRALADNIAQLAWMADHQGTIFWYNKRWYEYTGKGFEDANQDWRSVHHPDHLERVAATFQECVESGLPWEDTFPLRSADGSYRWFLTRALPIHNSEGNVSLWFGTNTDITEQKRLEEESAAANEKAQKASQAKDAFIALVSHELRSPLNSIVGWSSLVERGHLPPEKLAHANHAIRKNALEQARLIEDLLDVSRIATGKISLDLVSLDLDTILRDVFVSYEPLAIEREISLVLTHYSEPLIVQGDAGRVRQIISNLLGNALKFTGAGGRIELATGRDGPLGIVTVRDSGIGISSEDLPVIFDRFKQLEGVSRINGGLGLGLHIVQHLVELHGGTIEASSDGTGLGSTFTVKFPLLQRDPSAGAYIPALSITSRDSKYPAADLSGIKVLVVEDDEAARTLLSRTLEDCHAKVVSAGSTDQALAAVRMSVPDIIISDIQLPGKDGITFLQELRELKYRIPAIALTAFDDDTTRQRTREAGFDLHVVKPVMPEHLVAVLGNILGRRISSRSSGKP